MTNQSFIRYLTKSQMSQNTIRSYCFAVDEYNSMFQIVSTSNLLKYKRYLLGKYSPSTANVRIRAINRYLRFIGKGKLALHGVKIQQVSFLGDTLDNNTYEIFKSCLKGESNLQWYFIVSVLSTTGVRIGELVRIKAEQVILGYIDVIGKGGKCRRVFLTDSLRNELLMWMELIKRCKGPLFRNKFGDQISTRGVSAQLQRLAMKYGIAPAKVHPHAFRHLFARKFLEKTGDVALLADLLGHSSIETTRIYLRKTSEEQHQIVEKVITW